MNPLWSGIVGPAQAPIVAMGLRGIRVDEEARQSALAEAQVEREQLREEVTRVAQLHVGGVAPAPPALRCEEHPEFEGVTARKKCGGCANVYAARKAWKERKDVKLAARLADFNPGSKDHLAWLLHDALKLPVGERTDTGRPRVTVPILEALAESGAGGEHEELLTKLVSLAHVQHRISVDLNPPVGEDGRHHPSYTTVGTSILRVRSGGQTSDPDKGDEEGFNSQNIPEKSRRIYVADPGHLIVEVDAAQVEWVLMMLLAGCRRGVDAYVAGRDVHTENARDILAVEFGWDWAGADGNQRKAWRRGTKTFTHGADYGEAEDNLGRRFRGIMEQRIIDAEVADDSALRLMLKRGRPLAEVELLAAKRVARRAHKRYFDRWPEIRTWHAAVEEEATQTRRVRNPFGFQRRFLDVTARQSKGVKRLKLDRDQLKEAVAFGPASTNAALWYINLRRLYDAGFDLLAGEHDNHVFQVREQEVGEKVSEAVELCQRPVEELTALNWGRPFGVRFEAQVGRNRAPRVEHEDEGGIVERIENEDGLWSWGKPKRRVGEGREVAA